MSATALVHGLIDGEGRLVAADPPLAALQRMAGGSEGGVLAPPALAAIVRLVRRIGIVVSRGVVVADEEGDLDLWVRAQPDDDSVRLAIAGWTWRPALIPPAEALPAHEHDFLRADADFVWETDSGLLVTMFAPAGGLAAPDAIGQPLTRLLTLLADDDGGLPILAALATQSGFDDQLARLGDGDHVRLCGAPLVDGGGRFRGFRGSAVGAADPAVVRSAGDGDSDAFGRRLDAALRGPLDRIVANAETIRAQADGPLRRDYSTYAADIATAGRHLLALVGDLVDLQAIERPDFAIMPEPIDLADIGRRAAGLLGVRASDRGLTIDRPDDADTMPALGDFRRVLQILVNLIGNAVRYSPEGGTLWIRCEGDDRTASITVADRGRGLAIEDQARIFDKFERVDTSEAGGTGLGLYISRRLARALGGDITVESAPGLGARFTLTLPA